MEKSVKKEGFWTDSTSSFYCFTAAAFSNLVFDNFLIVTI